MLVETFPTKYLASAPELQLYAEYLVPGASSDESPLIPSEVVNYVYHTFDQQPVVLRAIILEVKCDETATISIDTSELNHEHHNVITGGNIVTLHRLGTLFRVLLKSLRRPCVDPVSVCDRLKFFR